MKETIKKIMEIVTSNGFECYLVGGAVRDLLLDNEPKDYDFASDAKPEDIKQIFEKVIATGEKYGTMTVLLGDETFEITTYRKDFDYDGRRPTVIKFASTLEEDLARRDFTINAMAMDIDGEIIDYFGGREDIKNGIVKCVGNPKERFKEDALRQVRAIRFASRYEFDIEENTLEMIDGKLSHISKERIREELNKMLMCDRPSLGIRYIMDLGLYEHFHLSGLYRCLGFDQKNPHHDKTIFDHTMFALDFTEKDLLLRLATLFHDVGKPQSYKFINEKGTFHQHHKYSADITKEVMTNLKYSNDEIETTVKLVYNHMSKLPQITNKNLKRLIVRVKEENLDRLFKLMVVDRLATKPPVDFEDIYKLKFRCEQFIEDDVPMVSNQLKIDGNDIMALGYSQGKEIGEIINHLLELVLDDETLNEKEKLVAIVEEAFGRKIN